MTCKTFFSAQAYIPPFPPQDLPRTSEARSLLDDLSSRSGFSNSQDWLASLKSPYELAQMLQTFSSPKSVNKMKQLACPVSVVVCWPPALPFSPVYFKTSFLLSQTAGTGRELLPGALNQARMQAWLVVSNGVVYHSAVP